MMKILLIIIVIELGVIAWNTRKNKRMQNLTESKAALEKINSGISKSV